MKVSKATTKGGECEFEIVNLTPHTLNIFDEDGNEVMTIEPSGQIARLKTWKHRAELDFYSGPVPLYVTRVDEPEGLPEWRSGTIFVVSGVFRAACPRPDLWQPGELLRDEQGRPIGCIGLSQ